MIRKFMDSLLPVALVFLVALYGTCWLVWAVHTWWSIATGVMTGLFAWLCLKAMRGEV